MCPTALEVFFSQVSSGWNRLVSDGADGSIPQQQSAGMKDGFMASIRKRGIPSASQLPPPPLSKL